MHELSLESVEISTDALERFERKVWLTRCKQDADVNAWLEERVLLYIDDGGFLFMSRILDGGDTVSSLVLPEEWYPSYRA